MKVLVITGSPHKKGTTAALTDQFIKGAFEAGHEVYRFDAAFKEIHPCTACGKCHKPGSPCVFRDDMDELNPELLTADAVVFVSPIYYYDINAQLKVVIDRFYANDTILHGDKKAALILAMADNTMRFAEGAISSYRGMTEFMEWENVGELVAVECGDVSALGKTNYLTEAYELGRNL